MPPKSAKTADTFTPEEQKQFDNMREADKAEPAPEPSPEPEQKAADPAPSKAETPETKEPKESKEPKEVKMVPHGALEEERQKRKAAEQRDREREIEFAKVQERLNLLTQAMEFTQKKEAPKPTKMEIPDPEKDALGAVKAMAHNQTLTQQEIETLRQYKEQRDKLDADRQQYVQLTSWAAQQEREFASKTPEYNDASQYLMQSRLNELTLTGMTPDQAQTQMSREILEIANTCRTTGKNPAELTLALAKSRGYQAKQPEQPAAPQPEVKPMANAAAEIDRLAAQQRANRSLSDVSGNAPTGKIDAKDLARMSDAQFAKVLKGMTQQEQYEYFGN